MDCLFSGNGIELFIIETAEYNLLILKFTQYFHCSVYIRIKR